MVSAACQVVFARTELLTGQSRSGAVHLFRMGATTFDVHIAVQTLALGILQLAAGQPPYRRLALELELALKMPAGHIAKLATLVRNTCRTHGTSA